MDKHSSSTSSSSNNDTLEDAKKLVHALNRIQRSGAFHDMSSKHQFRFLADCLEELDGILNHNSTCNVERNNIHQPNFIDACSRLDLCLGDDGIINTIEDTHRIHFEWECENYGCSQNDLNCDENSSYFLDYDL